MFLDAQKSKQLAENSIRRLLFTVSGLAVILVFCSERITSSTEKEISERLNSGHCRTIAAAEAAKEMAAGPLSGEEVYDQYCSVCHTSGVGALLFVDAAAWAHALLVWTC